MKVGGELNERRPQSMQRQKVSGADVRHNIRSTPAYLAGGKDAILERSGHCLANGVN